LPDSVISANNVDTD